MIASLITLLLSCCTAMSTLNVNKNSNSINNIEYSQKSDNLVSLVWHNNKTIDDDTNRLFEKYSVNYNDAINSGDVYIQEEYVYYNESEPNDLLDSKIQVNGIIEDDFTHNDGYIRFITKAYTLGFYDGNIIYHIELTTEQKRNLR